MKLLKWFVQLGGYLIRTLAFGWLVDLATMIKRFWQFLRAVCAREKLPHPQKEPSTCCIRTAHPSVHRPDPCIYSQTYLMQQGLPVTWDNPDIVLKLGGVIVAEYDLMPSTQYEIEATIWNNSFDGPAVGLRVDFSFLSFGVGTVSNPIGTTFVNVGVKGSIYQPARATVPWTTPATPGHYCIQVALSGVDDANPNNNMGQNNVDVVAAASTAHFRFPLRNPFDRRCHFQIDIDTYRLPELEPCDQVRRRNETRAERIRRMAEKHRASGIGIPQGWDVAIAPKEVALDAGEQIDVEVDITPPDNFTGKKQFNLNALSDDAIAGGFTLVVTKS